MGTGAAVNAEPWKTQFLAAYRTHRLDHQVGYYARRSADYDRARRWTLRISAIALVLSALFGALSTADVNRRAMWAFVAAFCAALASAFAAYEASFGLEPLSRQYADTMSALRLAAVEAPSAGDLVGEEGTSRIRQFVGTTEVMLRSEVDTWLQRTARIEHRSEAPLRSTSGATDPGTADVE
jgi:SMODS and SLOG-associating 2TM effector domain 1